MGKDYVTTMSGRMVSLVDPQPEDIHLPDILAHLMNLRRFNGSIPWSVLEHSVLAWLIDSTPETLMHDAHEAYIGDIITPVGILLGASVAQLKQRLQAVINDRLGLRHDYDSSAADLRAMEIEIGTLMQPKQAALFLQQERNAQAVLHTRQIGLRPFVHYWGTHANLPSDLAS